MSTAQVAVLAHDVAMVRGLLNDRLPAAAGYLYSEQRADGRWLRQGDDWHTSITGWVLLALSGLEPHHASALGRGLEWLSARQGPDGGFGESDTLATPNTYSTSYAIAALSAAGGRERPAVRGVAWLARVQDDWGGFGDDYSVADSPDPSLTAYVAHALSRVAGAEAARICKRCARFIARTQRPSGAWPAWYEDADSVEGTAASLRVLLSEPARYRDQISAGAAFLKRVVNLHELENWIVVSLAYLFLEDPPHGLAETI